MTDEKIFKVLRETLDDEEYYKEYYNDLELAKEYVLRRLFKKGIVKKNKKGQYKSL